MHESLARNVALTAVTPILWGTTYYTTTEYLPDDRPLLAGTLRALPAGILLFLVAGRVLPRREWWWKSAVLGVLNIGAFFPLLFLGAYRLPGGVAASVGAVQPVIAAALAAMLIGEHFGVVNVVSGALGAIGVGLLVLRNEIPIDALGLAAALGGTISMATGVVLTRKWGRPVSLLAFTSWQLLAGGLLLVPIALAIEGLPPEITTRNVVGYGWLTLIGTALAYTLWFRGIGKLPVAATSVLGLLTPVMAAIIGWAALDQSLRPLQFVGVAAILGSVAVIQWWSGRTARGAAAAAATPAVLVPVASGR